jgi:hypothetical protein
MKCQHLKVLLLKDWLTLKRNKGFVYSFILVPIAFCALFCWLQSLALDGTREGSLLAGNMHYTTNEPARAWKDSTFPAAAGLPAWFTYAPSLESLYFADLKTGAS